MRTPFASVPWGLKLCSWRERRDMMARLAPRPPPLSPRALGAEKPCTPRGLGSQSFFTG